MIGRVLVILRVLCLLAVALPALVVVAVGIAFLKIGVTVVAIALLLADAPATKAWVDRARTKLTVDLEV